MKVYFEGKDRHKILENIKIAMGDRRLAELVQFSLDGGKLEVTISKLGTSVIHFSEQETGSGLEYALKSEKIALTHRSFKDEVREKIIHCLEKAGGKVIT